MKAHMAQSVRVLAYHRIAFPDHCGLDPRLISARPDVFRQQMNHLAKHYNVVSLRQFSDALDGRCRLPNRAVMITFDDAYRDLAEHAVPVLKHYQLPATIFVPTAYPNRPERCFWWDRLYRAFTGTSAKSVPAKKRCLGQLPLETHEQRSRSLRTFQDHLKSLPHTELMLTVDEVCRELCVEEQTQPSVFTWDELRNLSRDGFAIAAHTQTHPILTQVSSDQLRQEVCGSRSDVQREIGVDIPVFCYPDGGHNQQVIDAVAGAGFDCAFAMTSGHTCLPAADRYRLSRISITRKTTPAIFRLRLMRLVSYVDQWRHRERRRRTSKHVVQ